MTIRSDVIVLGAGIVGVSTALNLQQRGRSVVLIDRAEVGRGTSYGNGGLIQREAILPYAFPQDFKTILSHVLNNRRDAYYHLDAMIKLAPVLFHYWRNGTAKAVAKTTLANIPLFEHCLTEHFHLAEAAGVLAAFRPNGWIRAFRRAKTRDRFLAEHELAAQYGVDAAILDARALAGIEPHLNDRLAGALQYRAPYSLANPLALTQAYEMLFTARGGKFLRGDARTLSAEADGRWRVAADVGAVRAKEVAITLGPWSDDIFGPLGYKLPFFVKRGYHMHYSTDGDAFLNSPTYDVDGGYMLAPMEQGIRLVTGAEFACRDAPPTIVQLNRVEPWARNFFPIKERKDKVPWMGSRPCFPDMLPVISEAPKHPGLWFAFGHAHHGLTLAGVTGRLISEMMTGETPFINPAPYCIDRFR